MRGFVLHCRNIHLAKESNSRRGAIVDAICDAGVTATNYDAGPSDASQLDARAACLQVIINDVRAKDQTLLVSLSRTTHSCSGTSGFFTCSTRRRTRRRTALSKSRRVSSTYHLRSWRVGVLETTH